eukprot:jgi/Galph1/4150/GphlegSOOS_G2833.1
MLRASEKARKPRVHIFDGPSPEDLPFFKAEIKKRKLAELALLKSTENTKQEQYEAAIERQREEAEVERLQEEEREISALKQQIQDLQLTKKQLFQRLKDVLNDTKR